MLNKEKTYLRDKHFLQRHPLLQPKMRAILLDWLMEVSWSPWRLAAGPFVDLRADPISWVWSHGTFRAFDAVVTLPRRFSSFA